MTADRARLKRLQRLQQIRAIGRRTAALEAAQAEGTLAQLEALASRTRRMADDYRDRSQARDGHALHQLDRFAEGLDAITRATTGDAGQARDLADRKQHELVLAERRRSAAEDRAESARRELEKRLTPQSLGPRRNWHGS